jgi:DNA-binding response OmpR family regulator
MPRILVVDDETSIREWLYAILSRKGHDVIVATDAREALAACSDAGPCFDLVVSDIGLPGVDGHELTRRMAAHCPTTRVVHMSGNDSWCDDCPYTQICPLLKKPLRAVEVTAVVDAILARPPSQLRNAGERL